jgi:hypothetical protein
MKATEHPGILFPEASNQPITETKLRQGTTITVEAASRNELEKTTMHRSVQEP